MANMSLSSIKQSSEICDIGFTKNPTKGPKILFFSGGTALSPVASCLTQYTNNATYLITPFDSGGSSAVLRQAFTMPAVGDLRARLMALADKTRLGYKAKMHLFGYRFPKEISAYVLFEELEQLISGKHPAIYQFPKAMLNMVKEELVFFMSQMPKDLDLLGASVGNILLTSRYLQERRNLEAAVTFFSRWLGVRGIVRPLVDANAHLCVQLENGEVLIGQHRFTGKKDVQISSSIEKIWFTKSLEKMDPVILEADETTCKHIRSADLICFPMGSFFSSVIANLLPKGIAEAITTACCTKVFIPNVGKDPETFGLSLQDQIEYLGRVLSNKTGQPTYPDVLLLDTNTDGYLGGVPSKWLKQQGIQVVTRQLMTDISTPYFDPEKICQLLITLSNSVSYSLLDYTHSHSSLL